MKTFYQITPEGFNLMVKLDTILENVNEFYISEDFIINALSYEHDNLRKIWNEWHDMEFCDLDLQTVLGPNIRVPYIDPLVFDFGEVLHTLKQEGLIRETYTDND